VNVSRKLLYIPAMERENTGADVAEACALLLLNGWFGCESVISALNRAAEAIRAGEYRRFMNKQEATSPDVPNE